jgi:hypothetical protein
MKQTTVLALSALAVALCAAPAMAAFDLQITEMWPGMDGADLTEDWFEVHNAGDMPWTEAVDGQLRVADSTGGFASSVLVQGFPALAAGETAIVILEGAAPEVAEFFTVWNPDKPLAGVPLGYADGSGLGLGGGGDTVNIWVNGILEDTAAYPDQSANSGQSWDVALATWSTVGNAAGAVATTALGGDAPDLHPAIGSPGMIVPEPSSILLAGIGGLALALIARRRIKR